MQEDWEPDGEIINDSFSTNAPNVRPSLIRFIRFRVEFAFLLVVVCILLAVASIFGVLGYYFSGSPNTGKYTLGLVCFGLGGLLLLAGIAIALLLGWMLKRSADIFENALLTPAILAGTDPPKLLIMAHMDNGSGEPCWGLKWMELTSLPVHEQQTGTRVPCVSSFLPGDHPERWEDFSPVPLAFGIGDSLVLQTLATKTGDEEFARLEDCIRKNLVPKSENELLLIDAKFSVIERKVKGDSGSDTTGTSVTS